MQIAGVNPMPHVKEMSKQKANLKYAQRQARKERETAKKMNKS
jgi:hypothetical protein